MSIIKSRVEVTPPSVGSVPVSNGASPKVNGWKLFTATCSSIAKSLSSDSGGLCRYFPFKNGAKTCESSTSTSGSSSSDGVVKKRKKRRSSTKMIEGKLRFKSAISTLKSQLYGRLPSISEHEERLKAFFENVNFESGELSESNPANQFLVEELGRLEDFDFAGCPNQFPRVAKLVAAPEGPSLPSYVGASDESRLGRGQRIVDYVPSTFPASRPLVLDNFRGKIISENFAATRQLNIHNDAALTHLLTVLENSISDESFALLDALSPADVYEIFESFCAGLDVSPFNKNYHDI